MKLYEIHAAIQELYDSLQIDEETGELLGDVESLLNQIHGLQMEKKAILVWLAKTVLNLRAQQTALKSEESRLKTRRQRLEKKETRLLDVIDRECAGETTDLEVATMTYRKTSHVEVQNPARVARWLKRNKFLEAYEMPEPKIYKTEVRKLIRAGKKVPGCEIVDDVSKSLK